MSAYEKYRDDLPDFIRGRLDVARATALLKAAEDDEVLRAAIETERSLDRWLDYYEVPGPGEGFEGRFWRRFHEERATRRSLWILKLVGPLAAAVLIAIGIIVFVDNDDVVEPDDTPIAEKEKPADSTMEVTWEDDEFSYLVGGPSAVDEGGRGDKLDAEALATMRALDNPAFFALDDLERPEDLGVIDDFELLSQLAEDE